MQSPYNSSAQIFNHWSKPKRSSSQQSKSFRFGGTRKDPLNLNELIEQRKQSQPTMNGNDRWVEILLPPNIYDPLCLDSPSSNDQSYKPMKKT